MATQNNSAGVYSKQTDLSQRAENATTSVAAIVGRCRRGTVGEKVLVTDDAEYRTRFGTKHPKLAPIGYHAERFLKVANQLYVVRTAPGALTAGAYLTTDDPSAATPIIYLNAFDDGNGNPQGIEDPLNNLGFMPDMPGVSNILCYFVAENPGQWNSELSIQVRPSNPLGVPVGQGHVTTQFYVDVFVNYQDSSDLPVESFLVSREIETDADGNQLFIEDVINNRSNYIRVVNNPYGSAVEIRRSAFEQMLGGTDGNVPTDADIMNAWDEFEDPEELEVNLLINAGYSNVFVHRKMLEIAEKQVNCFAILDMPEVDMETQDAIRYRRNDLNVNTSYGALFSPSIQDFDDDNGRYLMIPPSGEIAARIANTDIVAQPWFSPAGLNRGRMNNVSDLSHDYTLGQRNSLVRAQVNYIQHKQDRGGYYLMEAETLMSTPSAFQNISVQRLFGLVRMSLSKASRVGLFDPNDDFLRAKLRRIALDYLQPIRGQRAYYEAEVVCDDRNNTNATIANNDLYIDIYLDPVIPGKRIHVTAIVNAQGDVSISEN